MSPAMKYRNSLDFGPKFDSRRSEIAVYKDWDSGQFVVTVFPKLTEDNPGHKARFAYYEAADAKAKSLWLEKYHVDMPEHVEHQWAETSFADAIPYIGTVQLSKEEAEFLKKARSLGDFTLDMLWLIVEGLGWRPGNPVSEDDLGWLAVWAEHEECGGYYEIVRAVLAMPEPTYIGHEAVMPAAVRAAYA